jgi:hypothetical protein
MAGTVLSGDVGSNYGKLLKGLCKKVIGVRPLQGPCVALCQGTTLVVP